VTRHSLRMSCQIVCRITSSGSALRHGASALWLRAEQFSTSCNTQPYLYFQALWSQHMSFHLPSPKYHCNLMLGLSKHLPVTHQNCARATQTGVVPRLSAAAGSRGSIHKLLRLLEPNAAGLLTLSWGYAVGDSASQHVRKCHQVFY